MRKKNGKILLFMFTKTTKLFKKNENINILIYSYIYQKIKNEVILCITHIYYIYFSEKNQLLWLHLNSCKITKIWVKLF